MSKNKIADSIIIRVGGGIREVQREHAETAENPESVPKESNFDQTEEVHPLKAELGLNTKIAPGKTIN